MEAWREMAAAPRVHSVGTSETYELAAPTNEFISTLGALPRATEIFSEEMVREEPPSCSSRTSRTSFRP